MGSAVQTKTIAKLCNPKLYFSDWKSMGGSTIILGSTTQWFGWQLGGSTRRWQNKQSLTQQKDWKAFSQLQNQRHIILQLKWLPHSKEGLFVDGKDYLQYKRGSMKFCIILRKIGPFLEKIAIVILVELHKQHLCIWNSKRTTFLWNESLGAVYNQVCSQFSKQSYKYAQILI